MKRVALVVLCCVLFSGGSTFAQCFGSRCVSTVRVSSFGGGGLRARLYARRVQRDISSAIRTQNALNSLAFAQSFVAQSFVAPQFIQSFAIPQVQSYVPTYTTSYAVPQSAPVSGPADDTIPRVTGQLRQLQEMTRALKALQAE